MSENLSSKGKYAGVDYAYLFEVSGRDSIAAVIKYCQDKPNNPFILIPTAIYHPGEYGNFSVLERNVTYLRNHLHFHEGIMQIDPMIALDASQFFIDIILKPMGIIQRDFRYFSPCPPCHLLFHLMRVPIAHLLGVTKLITGERIKHGNRIKINQVPEVLNYFRTVLREYGIDLIQPLYSIEKNDQIAAFVGSSWNEDVPQTECIFSKNYLDEKNQSIIPSDLALSQLRREYLPRMKKVIQ